MALFKNRKDAGRKLAEQLGEYRNRDDVIVLALPRGGVPVAAEVADALHVPMDVFIVRKLGVPGHEELALGAIASGGIRVLNQEVIKELHISQQSIESLATREREELIRRQQEYRGNRPEPDIQGKTVILVDDGLATGASMYAAVLALRQHDPAEIVVAVPTASAQTCEAFEDYVEDVVCATTPEPFYGVGMWYDDFSQTTDAEVREILAEHY